VSHADEVSSGGSRGPAAGGGAHLRSSPWPQRWSSSSSRAPPCRFLPPAWSSAPPPPALHPCSPLSLQPGCWGRRQWDAWWGRRWLKEPLHPCESDGHGGSRENDIAPAGDRCRAKTCIHLLQETDEGAGAVGLFFDNFKLYILSIQNTERPSEEDEITRSKDRISTTATTTLTKTITPTRGRKGAGGACTQVEGPRTATVEYGTTEPVEKLIQDDRRISRSPSPEVVAAAQSQVPDDGGVVDDTSVDEALDLRSLDL
jgi:hypothetical protein